jgi:hypothetical protein
MPKFWSYFFGSMIGASFAGVILFGGLAYYLYDPSIPNYYYSERYSDAINVAVQTGRLDTISVLLAILAIIMAIFGLVGFGYVRHRSEIIASNAVKEIIPKEVLKWMSDNAPELIYNWLDDIEEVEGFSPSIADDISQHVDPNSSGEK